jgi:uncharacterized protein YqjF (DUF2071 family)
LLKLAGASTLEAPLTVGGLQMQIVIHDLLFINYAVPLERVRSLVPDQFELDTRTEGGVTRAFVSVVPFTIAEIRSASWSFGRVSFNQINYRVYIVTDEGPAVYFLNLKVGSRTVAASASFFGLPVDYEGIKLAASRSSNSIVGSLRYSVESEATDGLSAQVTVNEGAGGGSGHAIPSEFITERPFGFITTSSGAMYKIVVGHPTLRAAHARVDNVRAPLLESVGILEPDQSENPHSVLYVEDALFQADTPIRHK